MAQKLDKACINRNIQKLKVFVQVKTSDEETKSGVEGDELYEIILGILKGCPHLEFAGLMTIGKDRDIDSFKVR